MGLITKSYVLSWVDKFRLPDASTQTPNRHLLEGNKNDDDDGDDDGVDYGDDCGDDGGDGDEKLRLADICAHPNTTWTRGMRETINQEETQFNGSN